MSELIIDQGRGLTALDLLSKTYKKASKVARKSTKAALSLALVFFAFLGFSLMSTDTNILQPTLQDANYGNNTAATSENVAPEVALASSASTVSVPTRKSQVVVAKAKSSQYAFAGLDKRGVPSGFTVSDSSGFQGSLYVFNRALAVTESELIGSFISKTENGAANILLSQHFVIDAYGFRYSPFVSYGRDGAWTPLSTAVTYFDSERQTDGNYLVTASIEVDSEVESNLIIPAAASGRDLSRAPRQIITRLVMNPEDTQILAQAVHVVEKKGKV
jgi:hypothetical protein